RKPFKIRRDILRRWLAKRPWYVVFFLLIFLTILLAGLFNFHDPRWAINVGFLLSFLPMLALDSWELRKVKKNLKSWGLLDGRTKPSLPKADSSILRDDIRRSEELIKSVIDQTKLN